MISMSKIFIIVPLPYICYQTTWRNISQYPYGYPGHIPGVFSNMENHISVVVPCFNENITKIQHAVDHFTSSKLVSDVIIVDDNSTIPVK